MDFLEVEQGGLVGLLLQGIPVSQWLRWQPCKASVSSWQEMWDTPINHPSSMPSPLCFFDFLSSCLDYPLPTLSGVTVAVGETRKSLVLGSFLELILFTNCHCFPTLLSFCGPRRRALHREGEMKVKDFSSGDWVSWAIESRWRGGKKSQLTPS